MTEQEEILRKAAEAAQQMTAQPQVQGIPPQPVPTTVQLTTIQQGGKKLVVLIVQTPIGQNVFFLDPDGAELLAKGLSDTARQARSGLEIVTNGHVV